MQNDLISKSELLESLNDWIDENTDIKTILRWIEEFEIAYSVEKVIAELEEARGGFSKDAYWTQGIFNTVIDIVRNGGKE